MKISNKYSAIIEWIIAIVLIVVCLKYSILSMWTYGAFSPIKAHEESERTYHYGPSQIIKTIDLKGQKLYLGRYKDWFSADTVKRGIIRWYPSGNVGGAPIDYSKQLSYYWSSSGNKDNTITTKLYGYVNDANITTILLEEENGANQSRYDLDESRMFIFIWSEVIHNQKSKYLQGLNKEGKVIFEERAIY